MRCEHLDAAPQWTLFTYEHPTHRKINSFEPIFVVINQPGGSRNAASGPTPFGVPWRSLAVEADSSEEAQAAFKCAPRPKEPRTGAASNKLALCLYAQVALSLCVFQCYRTNQSRPFARAIRLWREMGRSSGYETPSS